MRSKMKLLLGSLMVVSLTSCELIGNSSSISNSSGKDLPKEVNISIIELNDMHGYAYSSSDDEDYNLASIASYIEKVRNEEEYDNVLLVANGDMFQGTAFSNMSHGLSVVKAMNEMKFDMMGIGNHEFDWGLDEVLKYWDGNESNGEANFPLINGNVRDYNEDNKLVGETNLKDNILPYTIVEKAGIKIGLLSYIGDQTNSICQNKFGSYYIDCYYNEQAKFINQIKEHALEVKKQGADIIVLNIHDGDSDSIENYNYNKLISKIKDDSDCYLIDAVINGHTHKKQYGYIDRTNGNARLPLVQGGCNCNSLGKIKLTISMDNKKVKKATSSVISNNTRAYEEKVRKVLEDEYKIIYPQISENLGVANSYVTREKLGLWTVGIMKQYASAEVSLINTGGIRSIGGIYEGSNITLEKLYEVNPFDNSLIYVNVKGSELKSFLRENGSKYYYALESEVSEIIDEKIYKMVTIDYVYYSVYYRNYFKNIEEIKISDLCARDLMVEELKANPDKKVNFNSNIYYIEAKNFQ